MIHHALRHLQDVTENKTGSELVSLILAREHIDKRIKELIQNMGCTQSEDGGHDE